MLDVPNYHLKTCTIMYNSVSSVQCTEIHMFTLHILLFSDLLSKRNVCMKSIIFNRSCVVTVI